MTEFDFDVLTGPSGPMRRGPSACGWTPAEEPETASRATSNLFAPRPARFEHDRPHAASRDA